MNVKIGEYDLEREFHLKLLEISLGTPEVKSETVDIPGKNGVLDYTEAITGFPVYKNAKHTLKFDFKDGDYGVWIERAGKIKRAFHGKRFPVTLGSGTYYYDARISVDTEKINQYYSRIEMELDAFPYRKNSLTSMDDWLWDSFCFESDIAQPRTKDIEVPAVIIIYGDAMPTGCVFHCSGIVTLEFKGNAYILPEGDSQSPDIIITEGENAFHFSGSGTVSVEYRGGRF